MQDRIYCSEQIAIPPALPQIIKEYSKAVLREQPADLVDFSIKYFRQLSALAPRGVEHEHFVPDLRTASALFRALSASSEELDAAFAARYGVPEAVHGAIVQLASLTGLRCDALSYTVLLLSLAHSNMAKVLESVIAAVSPAGDGQVKASTLMKVFSVLNKFDPRVEAELLDAVAGWVRSIVSYEGEDPDISFEMVSKAGLLPQ